MVREEWEAPKPKKCHSASRVGDLGLGLGVHGLDSRLEVQPWGWFFWDLQHLVKARGWFQASGDPKAPRTHSLRFCWARRPYSVGLLGHFEAKGDILRLRADIQFDLRSVHPVIRGCWKVWACWDSLLFRRDGGRCSAVVGLGFNKSGLRFGGCVKIIFMGYED